MVAPSSPSSLAILIYSPLYCPSSCFPWLSLSVPLSLSLSPFRSLSVSPSLSVSLRLCLSLSLCLFSSLSLPLSSILLLSIRRSARLTPGPSRTNAHTCARGQVGGDLIGSERPNSILLMPRHVTVIAAVSNVPATASSLQLSFQRK